jgi:hypothetical protein
MTLIIDRIEASIFSSTYLYKSSAAKEEQVCENDAVSFPVKEKQSKESENHDIH